LRHSKASLARFALSVALLFACAVPLLAQGREINRVSIVAPEGNCAAVSCSTAVAFRQFCRNSTLSTTEYICNPATGFYVPVGNQGQAQDLTIPAPVAAPTAVDSSSGGLCSNANIPHFYVAWANASGITQVSPAAAEVTPSGTTRKFAVTRGETVPGGASGWLVYWTKASEGHATYRLCTAGSAQSLLQAPATTTYTCNCVSGTTRSDPTTNETGPRAPLSAGILSSYQIGLGQTTGNGTDVGTLTEPVRLRVSSGFPEFSMDSGSTWSRPTFSTPTVIDICPSGCQYATLLAACQAKISTSANPLVFYIHAGVYSSATEQSCNGQDYATIIGDGPSTRVINTNGASGNYGTIGISNSTNMTVARLYAKGHRAIWGGDPDGGGAQLGPGGLLIFKDLVLESDDAQLDNDCEFIDAMQANTVRIDDRNRCTVHVDAFTNGSFTAPMYWYAIGNIVNHQPADGNNASGSGFAFGGIPNLFVSSANIIDSRVSTTGSGPAQWYGYRFNGDQAGCSSGCRADINSPEINIANQDGTGDGAVTYGVFIDANATELATVNIVGAQTNLTTTDTTGIVAGIRLQNATTIVNVNGGKWMPSGGGFVYSFSDGSASYGHINLLGVDYSPTQPGTAVLVDRELWQTLNISSPTSSTDPVWFKAPYNLTALSINCIVDPADSGESVVITVQECDGNGDSCAGLDGATTITCGNTNTADDGSLSNPTIDAGDWVEIDTGTVTGTVSRLAVTLKYRPDPL
jgi:hypothetical protein